MGADRSAGRAAGRLTTSEARAVVELLRREGSDAAAELAAGLAQCVTLSGILGIRISPQCAMRLAVGCVSSALTRSMLTATAVRTCWTWVLDWLR
ncbi:predicted protein [Streptomyces iranensis]|uniref:Uncharacterized protein n=1 Tax=Streptomyces iranensis TaxID=576784 RepID=A0A060ZYM3_9ACTN|nr:predicted protein [Streptomyces iranensis]